MVKAEMHLLELDEIMKGYKRLQTREDWNIEKKCKKSRMTSYVAALTAFIVGRSATMSNEALLARTEPYVLTESYIPRGCWWRAGWFHKEDVELMKPTGLVARYYRFLLGVKRFPLKHGLANFACGAVPAYVTFVSLNHWAQNKRLNSYMQSNTVFGEMSRELVRGSSTEQAVARVMTQVEKQMLQA
eukprot:NODE_2236_length_738_cov_128.629898_g1805_i0.p1 GENE.NODE_2236_length_738_cov_128.629898_g1805_i0~~NODE_2236_length_738_cov_128.629898_g1805_i0.p1  ORF type:complete len:187 (-),score=26.08 NODE_2236_length_738_cov_128.629898_g1805_i0:116-676(-)